MIINLSKQDPEDPQTYVESERNRASRQKQLNASVEHQIRAHDGADKRAVRLDHFFSKNLPNGRLLDIFRDTQVKFKNTNGKPPRWLTYEQLEASFTRLEQAGVLLVEMTQHERGVTIVRSEVTKQALANRRNARPPKIDALIDQLKLNLGGALQMPVVSPEKVRGCRQVAVDKWRVSLYFGGYQRALGCYPLETAVWLQDVLAFHFSAYRRPAHYNTSEEHAKELLTAHPSLATFCTELEKVWLAAGILVKPGELPVDKAEQRWQTIEARLSVIETHVFVLDFSDGPPIIKKT